MLLRFAAVAAVEMTALLSGKSPIYILARAHQKATIRYTAPGGLCFFGSLWFIVVRVSQGKGGGEMG